MKCNALIKLDTVEIDIFDPGWDGFATDLKMTKEKNYKKTGIEIIYENEIPYITFHFDNIEMYSIKMEKGSITIQNFDKANHIIDLKFDMEEVQEQWLLDSLASSIDDQLLNLRIIEKMRIRMDLDCEGYWEKAQKYILEHPESEIEEAFIKTKDISLDDKNLRRTMVYIYDGIKYYCSKAEKEENGELPITDKPHKFRTDISIETQTDFHKQLLQPKQKWKDLRFYEIKMSKFDERWFEATNLTTLNLQNCIISHFGQNEWKSFASGIKTLNQLKDLVISAKLENIPDFVFLNFPNTIESLYLDGNNLKELSSNISSLQNLKDLNLKNNPLLISIPWESLPKSIERFNLENTGITSVPDILKELEKLEDFYVNGTHLKNFGWSGIRNIENLKTGYVKNMLEIQNFNFDKMTYLQISNNDLKNFDVQILPQNLTDLLLNNNGIENMEFNQEFIHLTVLELSNNKLKSIDWNKIPMNLTRLELSNNEIKILDSPEIWTKINSLYLSNNKIDTIVIEGCDFERLEQDFRITLDLSKNHISELLKGFENFVQISTLNLRNNRFTFENVDEKLWKRIPKNLDNLNISENDIRCLPCFLSGLSLKSLTAIDCKTNWICPKLSRSSIKDLFLDNNPLQNLSFVPQIVFLNAKTGVYPIPYSDQEPLCIYIKDNEFQQSKKYSDKELFFIFTKVNEEEETNFCKCCAKCGNETESIWKVMMPMNCNLMKVKEAGTETIISEYYEYMQAYKWQTNVKTCLCEKCINLFQTAAKTINEKYKKAIVEYKKQAKMAKTKSKSTEKIGEHGDAEMPASDVTNKPSSSKDVSRKRKQDEKTKTTDKKQKLNDFPPTESTSEPTVAAANVEYTNEYNGMPEEQIFNQLNNYGEIYYEPIDTGNTSLFNQQQQSSSTNLYNYVPNELLYDILPDDRVLFDPNSEDYSAL